MKVVFINLVIMQPLLGCSYATVGDLNADVSALFARGLSIHTHAEWSTMNEELQLHANEMARRSTRLQEYWRALIVEYFFHVEDIGGESKIVIIMMLCSD